MFLPLIIYTLFIEYLYITYIILNYTLISNAMQYPYLNLFIFLKLVIV